MSTHYLLSLGVVDIPLLDWILCATVCSAGFKAVNQQQAPLSDIQ